MTERADFLAKSLNGVRSRVANAAAKAHRNPSEITLIAVTKTYPASDVAILASLGQVDFGENRTEEGATKSHAVPGIWHFQGQVQSRKLPEIAEWADFIHSIDQMSHIEKLARICTEKSKVLKIFIQLSLDGAPDRGGVMEEELAPLAQAVSNSKYLQLQGLMCVPPVAYEYEAAFSEIAQIHQRFVAEFAHANLLSAGMSSDFETAIAHGATHLRVGSEILGSRSHPL